MEVYHGQTSSRSLGNLPAPSDSPPPLSHHHRRTDTLTNSKTHFKDIINIEDPSLLRHRSRPSVRWASHQLPPGLLSPHRTRADSPQLRKPLGITLNKKTRTTSLPQAKGSTLHHTSGLFDATMLSKVPPTKQRKEPIARHSEVPLGHVTRGRRKKQDTSSISLMPTSKALVPSLGVYTRPTLAHNSLSHF